MACTPALQRLSLCPSWRCSTTARSWSRAIPCSWRSLRKGGLDSVLRREGGVLVGLDQVGKARQLLQQPLPRAQTSAGPSPTGQQYSRSAPPSPDSPSRARDLPSQPATVQSVKTAVAKLVNSMGLLAEGLGRVVVAASADIQAHWEPLVGEVDMGTQDTGLAQGVYAPNTGTFIEVVPVVFAGSARGDLADEAVLEVHAHAELVAEVALAMPRPSVGGVHRSLALKAPATSFHRPVSVDPVLSRQISIYRDGFGWFISTPFSRKPLRLCGQGPHRKK